MKIFIFLKIADLKTIEAQAEKNPNKPRPLWVEALTGCGLVGFVGGFLLICFCLFGFFTVSEVCGQEVPFKKTHCLMHWTK